MSASRLAAVSLAACVRWSYYSPQSGTEQETYYEEYIYPREDDLGRRKYLKVIVRTDVVWTYVETHRAKALPEGGGECVEDVHGWR